MIIIYFFLSILLIGFISFLIQKFKKDKKYNRKFYDFEDHTSIVTTILALIISFVVVNIFLEDPAFTNLKEQIKYGQQTIQPWLESNAYKSLLEKDTNNIDLEFNFIKSHFDENQNMGPSERDFNREGTFIFNYYTNWTKSRNKEKVDRGELGLALYYYYKGDHTLSMTHLENIQNNKLKYVNTYLGVQYYYNRQRDKALQCFAKEIRSYRDIKGAYYFLSSIYNYEKHYEEITPFAYDYAIRDYIPYEFKQRVYITHFDLLNYFETLISQIFTKTHFIGFFGALLILFIWIFYLKSVNIYQKRNWKSILFTVILSAFFVFPVWLLYDIYKYIFDFDLNENVLNDSLYCVFGIGVIEELVKLIPFLIVLKFTKIIKEPIDYIMYASLSALGFAFVENLLYFDNGSIHIIHSRALTASVAHMFFSSLIAYGLILAKFKYKKNTFLYGLLFFFIAAFAHGFYDFWLLNEYASQFSVFTFLCLLIGIIVYASITNNALNHSLSSDSIQLNTSKLSSNLAAGLVGVFLFEYIAMTLIYGPTIGNREFIGSTLSGGYLILFCSIRLSNLDIIPGEWFPIEYFSGFLPNQIIYGDKKPNYNSLIGKRITISLFRKKGILETFLPIEGEIIKREKISGFSGWFLVKLDKPMPIAKSNKEYILIKIKERFDLIKKGDNTIVSFVLIPDITLIEKSNKKLTDFKFIDWAIAN
jgi:RsiW-degrading membrane proteinase PrsW (M82 family)